MRRTLVINHSRTNRQRCRVLRLESLESRRLLAADSLSDDLSLTEEASSVSSSATNLDPQYTLKHLPRLQLGDAPLVPFSGSELDQVEILWQTVPAGSGSDDSFTVEYRLDQPGAPWNSATKVSIIQTGVEDRINHFATIEDLNFDTSYEYRVRHLRGDEVLETYQSTFRTRLIAGDETSFTFATYGDSAIGSATNFRKVQDRINQSESVFTILLGDNVYNTGTHPQSDARFDPTINPEAAEWIVGHIDYVSFGNHDVISDTGQPSRDNFSAPIPVEGVSAPASPPSNEPAEHNYSFDYGNVHFVTFDTNSLHDADRLNDLLNWVEADLAASQAQWKIVFGHHPVGGAPDKSEDPGDNYYQQVISRLRAAGVDLFMAGHSHTYSWTYPLLGEQNGQATFVLDTDKDYDKQAGLVQLVSGLGGNSVRFGSFGQFPFVAEGFSRSTDPIGEFGYAEIHVTPTQLTIDYVAAADGEIIDSFTITAEDGNPGEPSVDVNSPEIELSFPLDNGPEDQDPSIGQVVTLPTSEFVLQLVDDDSGIDDASVSESSITVERNGAVLIPGVHYEFQYNQAEDRIALFPPGNLQEFLIGEYILATNGEEVQPVTDQAGNPLLGVSFGIELVAPIAPTANNDLAIIGQNSMITIDVLANDLPGSVAIDATTVTVVESPGQGTAQVNLNGSITYSPQAAFFGTDSFRYIVSDVDGRVSNPAQVTINIKKGESAWHNTDLPADVDNNSIVNSIDLLRLIRDINANGNRILPPPPGNRPPPLFLDINGDGIVNPLDVALLITELNRIAAEGESDLIIDHFSELPSEAQNDSSSELKSAPLEISESIEESIVEEDKPDLLLEVYDSTFIDILSRAQNRRRESMILDQALEELGVEWPEDY